VVPCKKGHPHTSEASRNVCEFKYAERRVARVVARGPKAPHEPVIYNPPIRVQMGNISVVVFRTAKRRERNGGWLW
jgi:hypothetical protein